jgi:hypothetical protein
MRECAVAGLLVTTNRLATEQFDGRCVDGDVQVLFRRSLDRSRFRDENQWHILEQQGFALAYFNADGKRVEVEDLDGSPAVYAAELRRVVPFASALQGKVVLHGSAVRWAESVIAFLGGSGVGKSTLADALCDKGLSRVSDDLIPVRVRDKGVVVPWKGAAGEVIDLPLGAIYFLGRSTSEKRPVTTELQKQETLARLCRNSFGELRSATSWRTQFQTLAEVADCAAAASLVLPDQMKGLPGHVDELLSGVFPRFSGPGHST